jgi:hypothetical protein
MEHNYVHNDEFNMLTTRYTKNGVYHVTGETKEPLEVGDTINYILNDKFDILGVTKIVERRDNRDYPEGNGMFYSAYCKQVTNPNPPQKKTE